jgi:hypothetical protein
MKQFKPIEASVNAAFISKLALAATLDDNTNVEVPLTAQIGDAVVANTDGTFTHYPLADFNAKFVVV